MTTRKKREKNAELAVLPNVFQEPGELKGNWHSQVFKNGNPIVIEVGCGRGEYTVSLARRFPEKNFIGLDVKGPRLWKGAKTLHEEGRTNGAFIRTLIEHITTYFAPGEVSAIWVTFPDPYPQPARAMKRLVSVRFLELYKQILQPGGIIHFKTDNAPLFDWAIETFQANTGVELLNYTRDLYHSDLLDEITAIPTTYEKMFIEEAKTIKYSEMRFSDKPLLSELELKERLAEQAKAI